MDKTTKSSLSLLRQTLVERFLEKLGELKKEDADIIPLMVRYVETGDINLFAKYAAFCLDFKVEKWEEMKNEQISWLVRYRQSMEQLAHEFKNYDHPSLTVGQLLEYIEDNKIPKSRMIGVSYESEDGTYCCPAKCICKFGADIGIMADSYKFKAPDRADIFEDYDPF